MGNTTSFSASQTINNILTEIVIENSTSCESSAVTNQQINISNLRLNCKKVNISGVSQNANIILDMQCFANNSNQNDLSQELANKLVSELDTKISGLNLNNTQSTSINNIISNIVTNIKNSNFFNCVATSISSQLLNISDIEIKCGKDGEGEFNIENLTQMIVSQNVSKCMNENQTLNTLVQELDNEIESKIKTEIKGLELGSGSSASLFFSLIPIILVSAFLSLGAGAETGMISASSSLLFVGIGITILVLYFTNEDCKNEEEKCLGGIDNITVIVFGVLFLLFGVLSSISSVYNFIQKKKLNKNID